MNVLLISVKKKKMFREEMKETTKLLASESIQVLTGHRVTYRIDNN